MARRRPSPTPVDLTVLDGLPSGTPILLRWEDAHHVAQSWTPAGAIPSRPCRIVSCGLFLALADGQVFYAGDASDDPEETTEEMHVNAVSAVPVGCLVDVRVLEARRG